MADQDQSPQQTPQVVFKRHEDFQELYANSVVSETSIWDLRFIFGILDQSAQPNQVVQHTSVNLPWTWVKLLSYYIRIALILHEGQNGKIIIPPAVLPPDPEKITTGPAETIPSQIKEAIIKLHKEFLASLSQETLG